MRKPLLMFIVLGCGGGQVSWPRPETTVPAQHAEVKTVNGKYRRTSSQVLVRSVSRPTRANLDWAAYHANFMNADPAPEEAGEQDQGKPGNPFGGKLEGLTGTLGGTTLSKDERAHPLAFAPLVEYLSSRKVAGGLEEVGEAVRSESWGLGGGGGAARQTAAELFLHAGAEPELWVKVEFAPWFHGLTELPDEDGDGVPEVYGRVKRELVGAAAVKAIREDYTTKVLSSAEVKAWAHQLASYWYPSYNTDLVAPKGGWPDGDTEAAIKKELGGASFPAPSVVMRGKPQGQPTYNVFIVAGVAAEVSAGKGALALPKGKPVAKPETVVEQVKKELAAHGNTWGAWTSRLLMFHEALRSRLRSTPPKIKGLAGADGFLFYRNGLELVVGGDLSKQAQGKNPLPVIIEFKEALAARGVDFLFVPVPDKLEIFPDKLDAKQAALVGEVVSPFGRKLLLDLGVAGVETIDLLPPLLTERKAQGESLYQAQDTHWTNRGLSLAARLVAERIKQYAWYPALAKLKRKYETKPAPFSRHGDLHSRLPAGQRGRYKPESLVGQQVLQDGKLYEDDPDSPIVVLGDSFTGVYELTECEHAGVSAHIAREIGYPVDLVMSYGGGPNVRQKLLRRGADDLGKKRLVVWMMTARDLYHYWEDWEPLKIAAQP